MDKIWLACTVNITQFKLYLSYSYLLRSVGFGFLLPQYVYAHTHNDLPITMHILKRTLKINCAYVCTYANFHEEAVSLTLSTYIFIYKVTKRVHIRSQLPASSHTPAEKHTHDLTDYSTLTHKHVQTVS